MHNAVRLTSLLLATTLAVSACSGDDDGDATAEPDPTASGAYEATIRRTEHGVAHVTATDYGNLGFGQGYAAAEDHTCDLADQVLKVRSERAKHFGRGDGDAHVNSDFAYLALGVHARAEASYPQLDAEERQVVDGYAAGYNAYLADTGVDAIPGWCRGAEWVTPITPVDLVAYYRELALLASGRQLLNFVATAAPPDAAESAADPGADADAFGRAARQTATGVASNGWAIGKEMAQEGNGLLLANPHFPWEGELRLWETHLTIPGELDVYGATLHGTAGVLIGFNDAVAWTHTVSAGHRFTAYRLTLAPGDPTSYLYDGEPRAMESTNYEIDVRGDDGSTTRESRTLWRTHYGPVIDFPGVGWSTEQTIAYRDANIDNDVLLTQFLGMNRARSLDEFRRVHEEVNGIPWVNTVAVSAEGQAWYADTAPVANLSAEALRRWETAREDDLFTSVAYDNGAILLDGSDSVFEWQDAPGARSPGLVPFADQPQLLRDDYVFNANDSYWLANPNELLTGYSPMYGLEGTPRSPRTRMNVVMLEEGGGPDRAFTLDELQEAALANRSLTAELLKDAVVAGVCGSTPPPDIGEACSVLGGWDGRFDLDSTGAGLWRLFIDRYEPADLRDSGRLFADAFDPADPVGTPGRPAFADPMSRDAAIQALQEAVADLEAGGFTLDTPYGDLQQAPRGALRLPVHGGPGDRLGITNAIGFSRFSSTLEPSVERGDPVREGSTLRTDGWAVNNGSSFVMALEFRDDGPRARAFLTYGQSSDPQSPHFSDQTRRFADKAWRDVRFREADIVADPELREYTVRGDR